LDTDPAIFIGVVVYVALMFVVGLYAARRTHNPVEFIVAGRQLPLWLCSMTIVATWFGGGTIIGASGSAYDNGLLGVIADPFGAALCLFLVGLFFARLFRRLKLLTFVDFVEQRYGRVAAVVAATASLVSNIGWVGAMLVAFGLIFETLTGTPLEVGIVGGALVVFVYTSIGGLWAVALTDFVQMLIIIVGLVVLLVVVLIDVGGWGAIAAQLPEGSLRPLPRENGIDDWFNYFRFWVIFGIADLASQTLAQRSMAAKTERVAQNSYYVAGVVYLVFGMIPVVLGLIASVTMPGLADSEAVIPSIALEHLHPVAIAIFVGAILAAIMSSCDSSLLACASLVSTNLLPLVKRGASDKLRLIVARLAVPGCGIAGIVVALKAQVVYDVMIDANILQLAAVVVPFIFGVWWRKANRTGALAAMAAGTSAWLLTRWIAPEMPGDFIGLGVSLATMLIVTPLTQKSDPPRELVDGDGKPVELTDRLGTMR